MKLTGRRRQEAEDVFAAGFGKALGFVQRRVASRVAEVATTLVAAAGDAQQDSGALPLTTAVASLDPAAVYDPRWWRKGYSRYVRKSAEGLYDDTVTRAGRELRVPIDPEDSTVLDAWDELDGDTVDGWGAGLGPFVEGQIRAGMAAGDTVGGLVARLRDSAESWFSADRAASLATVAVAATYNRATVAAGTSARAQGTSSTKTWTATIDERTRPDHVDMDGVSVDVGEDFVIAGAYPAAGPHDARLPVEQTANCRCVLTLAGDGGDVADESTSVDDDAADYETDGSEDDALVAGGRLVDGHVEVFHTHGHCAGCGAWLEGRYYCRKCGAGYAGPLLDAGSEAPPDPAGGALTLDRGSLSDSVPINGDVGLVAADGVDEEIVSMTTTAPRPTSAAADVSGFVQPDPAPTPPGSSMGLAPWRGVVAVEGRPTGDGRMFRDGSLYWDDGYLPADVFAMLKDPDGGVGHDGSAIAGRMDRMWKQPAADGSYTEVWAEGVYDTSTATGAEVLRLQKQGMLTGVSVDVDSVEVVMPNFDEMSDDELFDWIFGGGTEEYSSGRIRRVTVCSIPAFIEARVYPVDETGALVASGASERCRGVRIWTPVEAATGGDGRVSLVASASPARKVREVDVFRSPLVDWDPLESTCRHASLSIL